MNNIDDLYIAEQGRKLSQFIAKQIDRGIREALGADTASLIENQAARIAELVADLDLMQQQADECIVASGSCGLLLADLPDYITRLKAERGGEGDQPMTTDLTALEAAYVAAEADYKAANAAAGAAFATFDAAREAYVDALDAATAKETDR